MGRKISNKRPPASAKRPPPPPAPPPPPFDKTQLQAPSVKKPPLMGQQHGPPGPAAKIEALKRRCGELETEIQEARAEKEQLIEAFNVASTPPTISDGGPPEGDAPDFIPRRPTPDANAREKKMVAVMAHPRSGPVYMSKLFAAFGLDVGDENRMGADGISSFLIGASECPRWGPDPWAYDFETRIHLVRDPLKVISSVLTCVSEGVQEYMAREAGVDPEMDPTLRVIEVYLKWHERIELRRPTMRIKVEEAPAALAKWTGLEPDPELLPPTDTNKRNTVFRTLAELNYKLLIGKLEWDPTTSLVRLSHTFAAEDGVDFNTFQAVIQSLLVAVENVRKELKKIQ